MSRLFLLDYWIFFQIKKIGNWQIEDTSIAIIKAQRQNFVYWFRDYITRNIRDTPELKNKCLFILNCLLAQIFCALKNEKCLKLHEKICLGLDDHN